MRLQEIQSALKDEGLDGWLFFDHHGRDLLAYRVLGLDAGIHCTRRWYYFIPVSGEPRGLMHRIEPHSIESLPGQMSFYSRWTEQAEGIRKLLGSAGRVAMQYSPNCAIPYVSMIDAGTVELIRSLGADVTSSANLIQLFEARWTDAQLESHMEAGRRMDTLRRAAFERIGAELRANRRVTEFEIQQFLRDSFAGNSLLTDHGPVVAVNANASDPHYEPTQTLNQEIRTGDFVLIDMWAKLDQPDSVYYDITWTGFCGSAPPSEIVRVFDVVSGARDRAVRRVQDAVAAKSQLCGYEVDDAARNWIEESGFGEFFIHRTGHSIGTEVHGTGANMDNFETHDDRRVIPRTCFSVEPGIYLPKFGIRSEVNVYVGEQQAVVTGEIQRALVAIG
jgi:Xaa-Pro aminopeptidase